MEAIPTKKLKIGLQLYLTRDALAENFEGTLRKVKEMGYECVEFAGHDPAQYLRKYIGRAHLVHLKDFICKNLNMGSVYELIDTTDKTTTQKPASKEEAGAEYLIVEQDQTATASSLECAKQSIDYLKSLGL